MEYQKKLIHKDTLIVNGVSYNVDIYETYKVGDEAKSLEAYYENNVIFEAWGLELDACVKDFYIETHCKVDLIAEICLMRNLSYDIFEEALTNNKLPKNLYEGTVWWDKC